VNRFPASEHYQHLDLGEPIPEIELRYDEFKRHLMRHLRWWMLFGVFLVVVLYVLLSMYQSPFSVGVLVMLFALGIMSAPQVIAGIQLRKRKLGRVQYQNKLDPWGVPIRQQIHYQFYFFGMMFALMQIPYIAGGISSSGLLIGAAMTLGGLWLAIATPFMRQPGQISCQHCSYPLVGLTLPCSCPECGAQLASLQDATDRPRVRDPRYLIAGVLLTLVGMLSFYVMFKHCSLAYAMLPRTVLIDRAPNSIDAFTALTSKSLTPQEYDQLEEHLIDAMVSGETAGFWSHVQGSWLAGRVFNSQLSESQIEQVLGVLGDPFIDAPSRARVGEVVPLSIAAPDVRMQAAELYPYYFFSGYQISGRTDHQMRSTQGHAWRPLQSRETTKDPEGRESPLFILIPEEPGMLRVKGRVVIALLPSRSQMSQVGFAWGEDNAFSFEQQPMWYRVVDLEHTIEVVE
jgi:hypothetical protein